jgi:hypothetical protein
MKLRTELLHTWHLGKPKDYVHYKVVTDIEHDALAAHALLQAIAEQIGSDERGPLLDRADELMREWMGK